MTIAPLHVTAADLEAWSERRNAQDQLPRLLRNLIFAVDPALRSIEMVSGEGVQHRGWDGVVDSDGVPPFVPAGISGWEISVRADISRKAEQDYRTRVEKTLGLDPCETTFVFATSRSWPGKGEWVEEKQADGVWRAVRVIDAHDLESWLERVPAVHLRISEELGKKPTGATALVWTHLERQTSTTPPFSDSLVIGGRTDSLQKVQEILKSGREVIPIAADSRDEALAFFGAALRHLDDPESRSLLHRSIVVWDRSEWRRLAARDEPLVLIPMFEDRANTGAATMNGHRVVVPLGREEGAQSDVAVEVGRARREAVREELETLGVPRHRATELAGIGRRSLLALKRQIAKAPDVERPGWAVPEEASHLVPAMFAGSWVDGNEKDEEALERLSGCSYDKCSRMVRRWTNASDPALRQVGDVWILASKEDSWRLLRSGIVRQDLEALREVCAEVFDWIDTRYDLPTEEQWRAGLLREEPRYSDRLRKGLADTLALLAARSEDFTLPGGSGRDWAARIVRETLERADEDWCRWASLGPELPLLAEAAPEQFLSAVERGSSGEDPILGKLFLDQTSSMWVRSPHTELLWALERLAWSPRHLPRAALALARLARIDPGGRTTSRPFDSLKRIFLVFRPHTAADARIRRQVLETILEREPHAGWELLLKLIPERHVHWMSTDRPEHRDWAPEDDISVTWREIFSDLDAIVDLALANVGESASRWAGLIGAMDRLRTETFERVVADLEEVDAKELESEGRRKVLDALRDLISRHRTFSEADWAMPEEVVERLNAIYDEFEPEDLIERHRWLFCERPALMDLETRDWETKQNTLYEKRVDAARGIHDAHGLEGLLALASGADRAGELGWTLGREEILSEAESYELLGRGLGTGSEVGAVARGLTRATAGRKGIDWVGEVLASDHGAFWTDRQKADFLLAVPHGREAWEIVERAGGEVPALYWSKARIVGVREFDLAAEAAEQLLDYGRPYSAIELLDLALHKQQDPPSWEVVLRALEEAPYSDQQADSASGNISHHVGSLVDRVTESGDVPDERIARLEWIWLPVLDSTRRSAPVPHRELARSPDFFAEIVALVYKAEGEEDVEVSENAAARARQGRRLLDSWRLLPGTREDGSLDGEGLNAWVETALEALRKSGRGEIGEFVTGQVLSESPSGHDGHWPHEAVRDVIERLESEAIERGVENGRYNSRGVTTRGPYDGGAQERALAERYECDADALMARTPRTAAMLRRMAETYRRDADREDRAAQLLEDLE